MVRDQLQRTAARRFGGRSLEPSASDRSTAGGAHRQSCFESEPGPIIASSDYIKAVPDQLSPWLGARLHTLGTDGFGRSENREHLRKFFEISAEAIVQATLSTLAREGKIDGERARAAIAELGFDAEAPDPVTQ